MKLFKAEKTVNIFNMNQKENRERTEKHTMDFKCFFNFSLAKFRTPSIGKYMGEIFSEEDIHYYSMELKWEKQDLN